MRAARDYTALDSCGTVVQIPTGSWYGTGNPTVVVVVGGFPIVCDVQREPPHVNVWFSVTTLAIPLGVVREQSFQWKRNLVDRFRFSFY